MSLNEHYFKKNVLLTKTLSMTLRELTKVLVHVSLYDFMAWRYPLDNSDVI